MPLPSIPRQPAHIEFKALPIFLFLVAVQSFAQGQDFTVKGSAVTVKKTVINNPSGLVAGNSASLQGTIDAAAGNAITIGPVSTNLTLSFQAGSYSDSDWIRHERNRWPKWGDPGENPRAKK